MVTSAQHQSQSVLERLIIQERRYTHLRRLCIVALVVWAAGALAFLSNYRVAAQAAASPATPQFQTIRVRRIELVNEAGQTRVLISHTRELGSAIVFIDGPGIDDVRVLLSSEPSGRTGVVLRGGPDGTAVILGATRSTSSLDLYDTNGNVRIQLMMAPRLAPARIELRDPSGQVLFAAP